MPQGVCAIHFPCDFDAWSALGSWSLVLDILPFMCCVAKFLNNKNPREACFFLISDVAIALSNIVWTLTQEARRGVAGMLPQHPWAGA